MESPPPSISPNRLEHSVSETRATSAADRATRRDNSAADPAEGAVSERTAPTWVLLARLVRPRGRHGELIAEILTDFPERFHERSRLFLIPTERVGSRPREVELENFWFLRSRLVLKIRGIDSINDAEALRGFAVAIPAAERAPLEPGSVYVSDLIGCRVIDLNRGGAEVGTIAEVDRDSSSTELLVLRRGNEELLIPFVAEYIVRTDVENRRLEMRLPEGLLDINAPITEEEKRQTSVSRRGKDQ
jgi:16S rRNA processing protein RimM